MKIIKRNGAEAAFDISKIESAITRANAAVAEQFQMTATQIHRIAESVALSCQEMGRSPAVEEIQDLVEKAIMAHGAFEVAKTIHHLPLHPEPWSGSPTRPMTGSSASSNATTRRPSRRTPTKTRR